MCVCERERERHEGMRGILCGLFGSSTSTTDPGVLTSKMKVSFHCGLRVFGITFVL